MRVWTGNYNDHYVDSLFLPNHYGCYYCDHDLWDYLLGFFILIILMIESFYWMTVLYLDEGGYVILGVIFGIAVLILMVNADYVAPLLLLMIWPFWLLYVKFVSHVSMTSVIINEWNKLVTLCIVSFVPNLLLILVISYMFTSLLVVIVTGSYLVISVTNVLAFIILVPMYMLWIGSYRIILLGLIPLPFFFANISLPVYLVYMVILVASVTFV